MKWLALLLVPSLASADNLASFGAGALIVKEPVAYDSSWSGFWLLDEDPHSGYASPKGELSAKEFVIELADIDAIDEVGFDVAGVDGDGRARAAKAVTAELGASASGPWKPLVAATLVPGKNDQRFKTTPQTGRYLRIVVARNQGADDYVELMGVGAYGKLVTKTTMPDASGAYRTQAGTFRVKQDGIEAIGCYEHEEGLIQNGGFDGRVLRFTWSEIENGARVSGPAVMVFPGDGKSFFGLWWQNGALGGRWDGVLASHTVGVCPHFKLAPHSGVGDALAKEGRARIYGILFDTDSDRLRPESSRVLDELVAVAKAEPTWKLAIEGHTDNTGAEAHNLTLSDQRAAAVKRYLVAHGVAADRLATKGYGATKPVATNDSSLGRSQNRRVEVTR